MALRPKDTADFAKRIYTSLDERFDLTQAILDGVVRTAIEVLRGFLDRTDETSLPTDVRTIELPDRHWELLKERARQEGLTVEDFLVKLLHETE